MSNKHIEKSQEGLTQAGGKLAEYYFDKKKLCCAQAVLLAINAVFDGGIDEQTAIRLGSGFCGGLGDAGCICGALSGGVMALGLLAGDLEKGVLKKKTIRNASKQLHGQFKEKFGSVCCRTLIEPFQGNKKKQKPYCQGITGSGAELTATMILELKPRLIEVGRQNIERFQF